MDLEEDRLEQPVEAEGAQETTEESTEAPAAEEQRPASEESPEVRAFLDEAEELAGAPEAEAVEQAAPGQRAWYVVHSYSGYENKVKKNLEQRIESMGMQDQIFQVIVPTEEEVEIRDGHKRTTRRRVFPGYLLVEMILNDDSWYVVRNTPGVTGFVGWALPPSPRPCARKRSTRSSSAWRAKRHGCA